MLPTLRRRYKIRNVSHAQGSSGPLPKGRRRDDVLMSAIRAATQAELAEYGYSGVTFEGVARRAQTSKPVLYRRYPSRAHMVVDALPNLRWQPDDELLAGESLRDDLLSLFGAAVENFVAIGIGNYRSLIADADRDLFAVLDAQVTGLAERTVVPALERARQRGELGPHAIPERAAASIGMLLRDEMLFSRNTVGPDTIAEIIDTVYLPLVETLSRQPASASSAPRHRKRTSPASGNASPGRNT
jgi:AcrR family transcriptional regulator